MPLVKNTRSAGLELLKGRRAGPQGHEGSAESLLNPTLFVTLPLGFSTRTARPSTSPKTMQDPDETPGFWRACRPVDPNEEHSDEAEQADWWKEEVTCAFDKRLSKCVNVEYLLSRL